MLYQDYKQKLEKRRRLFERFWRFRALILICALILLAAVFTLMGIKGTVYGETFPQSVEYGTELEYSAKAIFGTAKFEYRPLGGSRWTEEVPQTAGVYECRAVGKTLVGGKRAGKTRTFEIYRAHCEIKILLDKDGVIYGDKPQFSANLKYGDRLQVNSYTTIREGGNVKISLNTDEIRVINEECEDVSLSYEFEAHDEEALEVRRDITVKTGDGNFEYDGTAHFNSQIEITSPRKLAEGDEIVATTPTLTEAGSTINSFTSFAILNAAGEDVTESHYRVNMVYGNLTVSQRRITVGAPRTEVVYDGTEKTFSDYSITFGSLAAGQRIETFDERTEKLAGEYTNTLGVKIYEGENEVTRNYAVTRDFGKIVISKRKIKITTVSEEFTYDGITRTYGSESISVTDGETAQGESLVTLGTVTVREANGGILNNISYDIRDGEGNSVKRNYAIEEDIGRITILKRKIKITTVSEEFTYDGVARTYGSESISVTDGETAQGESLVTLGTVTVREANGGILNNISYDIRDGLGKSVKSNYAIEEDLGKITVLKRKIKIATASEEFTYDGVTHTYGSESISVTDGDTAQGQRLVTLGTVTVREANDGILNDISYDILDGRGNSVKSNYDIEEDIGSIKVNKRRAEISAPAKTFEYNGGLQGFNTEDYAVISHGADEGLALNERLSVTPYRQVNADVYENSPVIAIVRGVSDVTDNYDIVTNLGELEITRRAVKLAASPVTAVYDGLGHYPLGYFEEEGSLVSGHTVSATYEAQTEAGIYTLLPVEYRVFDGAEEVTQNYNVDWTGGKVEITRREFSVRTADGEWTYDGAAHSNAELKYENLAESQTLEYTASDVTEIKKVGEAPNEFTFIWTVRDGEGNEVTENYVLPEENVTYGVLKVLSRPLYFKTESPQGFEYDGKPHFDGNVEVENVAPGERAEVTLLGDIPSLKDVGIIENKFDFTYKVFAGSEETTENYEKFSTEYGFITVYVRALGLKTDDLKNVVYDGERHQAADYSITSGSFVEGDVIEIEYPSFVDAATYQNQPLGYKILTDSGETVTNNYSVKWQNGTIEILKRQLNYVAGSTEIPFIYDGDPHSVKTCALAEGSLAPVAGHSVTLVYDEWINAGSYQNIPRVVNVLSGAGGDVADNYEIKFVAGTVDISKRALTLSTGGYFGVYDGEGHTVAGYTQTEGNFVKNHRINASYEEFKDAGEYENIPHGDLNVYAPDGSKVTDNYTVEWRYGDIEISLRPITVTAKGDRWTYDGTSHLGDSHITVKYYENNRIGHSVKAKFSTMYKDAGEYENDCTVEIFDGAGDEVTENYDITYIRGEKIIIDKYKAEFRTSSQVYVYDGFEHCSSTFYPSSLPYFRDENNVFISHNFYFSGYVSVKEITDTDDEVRTVPNEFYDVKVLEGGEGGIDRTSNYDITFIWGALRVKSPVRIYVSSVSKEYDGEPITLTDDDWFIEKKPPDTDEKNIKIRLSGSLTYPAKLSVDEVFAQSEHTVQGESLYRIDFTGNPVTLEVKKRELTVTTASIKGVRGDQPLFGTDCTQPYWISYGSLLAGDEFENLEVTGILNPDEESAENTVSGIKIVDRYGNDVTEYYNVTLILGSLSWA